MCFDDDGTGSLPSLCSYSEVYFDEDLTDSVLRGGGEHGPHTEETLYSLFVFFSALFPLDYIIIYDAADNTGLLEVK